MTEKVFVDNLEPNIALVVKTLKEIADKQESNSDIVSLLEKLEQKDNESIVKAIQSIPQEEPTDLSPVIATLTTIREAVNALKLDEVSVKESTAIIGALNGILSAIKATELNIDLSTVETGLNNLLNAFKSIKYPEFRIPDDQIKELKPFADYATREGQEDIVEAVKKIKINVSGGGGPSIVSLSDNTINQLSGGYNFIQSEEDTTDKYYGFASSTGWKFKKKELSTGIWTVASGSGDYDTNWSDKENKIFSYY